MTIIESYHQALQAKGYQADSAQENAVTSLQRLADELQHYEAARQSLVKRWFSKPEPPRGIYLWGGVGRGKSFLMDLFYKISPSKKRHACISTNLCAGFIRRSKSLKANPIHWMRWPKIWPIAIISFVLMSFMSRISRMP